VTAPDDQERLHEALRDLGYEFAKAIGIVWLAKRIPGLELKSWVRHREIKREWNS
jgi:hypothetical protein